MATPTTPAPALAVSASNLRRLSWVCIKGGVLDLRFMGLILSCQSAARRASDRGWLLNGWMALDGSRAQTDDGQEHAGQCGKVGASAIRAQQEVEVATQASRQRVVEDVTGGAGGDDQQPDPEEPCWPPLPASTAAPVHKDAPF